jgi:hypothetical protein
MFVKLDFHSAKEILGRLTASVFVGDSILVHGKGNHDYETQDFQVDHSGRCV